MEFIKVWLYDDKMDGFIVIGILCNDKEKCVFEFLVFEIFILCFVGGGFSVLIFWSIIDLKLKVEDDNKIVIIVIVVFILVFFLVVLVIVIYWYWVCYKGEYYIYEDDEELKGIDLYIDFIVLRKL